MEGVTAEYSRAGWFAALVLLVTLVSDGFSGWPGHGLHQVVLLPVTAAFLFCLYRFLNAGNDARPLWTPRRSMVLAAVLEFIFFGTLVYEAHHFAMWGYRLRPALCAAVLGPAFLLLVIAACMRPMRWTVTAVASLASYVAGAAVSIACFPLNYLRSDMLPVVLWAGEDMLRGISPYQTMYIGARVYDFPYLPGMVLAYLPFIATGLDIRLGTVAYTVGTAVVVWLAARREKRVETAALLAVLLLSPFLQYRHELYVEPHWFTMVLALALFARGRRGWAAFVFGISMAIYQLSWVIFPFFMLEAFWRKLYARGDGALSTGAAIGEAVKLFLIAAAAFAALDGALLLSAWHHVANNTVSQWSRLPHALAQPMNLSYWATFLVRPAHLQRVQAVLMVAIFAWCVVRRRCQSAADAVRWMTAALAVFILFNVIVDGYFFLTLLVLALCYACIANGWWRGEAESGQQRAEA